MLGLNITNTTFLNQSTSYLTGNVKLVIDKDGYWLQSVEDVRLLKNESLYYKKGVDISGNYYTYFKSVNDYFNQENLPINAIWSNKNDNLKAGCRLNENSLYSEKFRYLAPLYINNDIPEYFVIFKLSNSVSEQYVNDVGYFIENSLKSSQCISIYKIKNESISYDLYDYLNYSFNHPSKKSNISYDFVQGYTNKITLYGSQIKNPLDYKFKRYGKGDGLLNMFTVNTDVSDGDITTVTEDVILKYFKKYGLISSNLINLEFMFDDTLDVENDDNTLYYGMYCDMDFLTKYKLNVDKYNKELPQKITYEFENISNNDNYIINDDNGVDLYVRQYLDDSDLDNRYMLLTEDKYNRFYTINDTDINNVYLNDTTINLTNFFGTDFNASQIVGKLINTPLKPNLKLTLNRQFSRNIVNVGDYFSIIIGNEDTKKEWRVIAGDRFCCGETPCHQESETITFKSSALDFTEINHLEDYHNYHHYHTFDDYHYHYWEEYHNYTDPIDNNFSDFDMTIKVDVTVNQYLTKLDEGDYITLNWANFIEEKSANLQIYKIRYTSDKKTIFTLIDEDGSLFWYNYLIDEIEFTYTTQEYYYTYFDYIGSSESVCNNIAEAINFFKNGIVEAIPYKNNVIFKSLFYGNVFKNIYLKYRFLLNDTDLSYFKVNDIELEGKDVYDYDEHSLFSMRTNKIKFTGDVTTSNKVAFYSEKTIADNINNDMSVLTKLGTNKIKETEVENTIINYTNYLENLENLDDYYIYTLENEIDDIIFNSNGYINLINIFYPKIYGMEKYFAIDKLSDDLLNPCYCQDTDWIEERIPITQSLINNRKIAVRIPISRYCFENSILSYGSYDFIYDTDYYFEDADLNVPDVVVFTISQSVANTLTVDNNLYIKYCKDEYLFNSI